MRVGDYDDSESVRILVPTSGGPTSREALRVAQTLTSSDDCRITALHVSTELGDEAREIASRRLEKSLSRAGVANE